MPRPAGVRAPEPALAFYRKYTEAMLRRFVRMSMECGRTPSLLGRELFRGKVTSCRVENFDDSVIFVHDVRCCFDLLAPGTRHLVRRIAMEEYSHGETASMLGLSLRTVIRRYNEGIDSLSRTLLDRKLLDPSILQRAEEEANA